MRIKLIITILLFSFVISQIHAQPLTQTIRGTVIEKSLQKPIIGATVQIVGLSLGDKTDEEGNFSIPMVPVGTQSILVSSIGYKENVVANLVVNSGKELVLTIALDEKINTTKELVIKATSVKNRPINELSVVSARAFSVEEAQKYAAAVNDPARMATNYAGVLAGDDGNNQIVIRGNSPAGLLWRMEGIDVPNPNHFAAAGSSGGGISILSSQLLSNSDFLTGAFTSEYGNALSGVFDLKLRKGNNQKREYTIQAGILGLNIAAEGPFSEKYKGSYLINYRYSTLSILSKLGVGVGNGVTNFQDLSYTFYLPTKWFGNFTIFSFGGLSDQSFKVKKDSTAWKYEYDRYDGIFASNTGMWGITHAINLGEKSFLKTAIGYSITQNKDNRNYTLSDYSLLKVYEQLFSNKKLTLTSTLNHRVSKKLMLRSGIIASHISFNYFEKGRETNASPMQTWIDTKASTQTLQGYSNAQYKLNEKLTFNAGLHYLQLMYNNSTSFEPRASIKYDIDKKQSLAIGYGKHSQMLGLGIYTYQDFDANGNKYYPNKDLALSKAHHFVLSHNYALSKYLKMRTEVYYQSLFDIPVSKADSNTFSALNIQNDYTREPLQNKGNGKNYGVEISLEKYLSRNFYYTLSTSWYQSKYEAANGKQYNTRFNGNKIINFIAGKDFVSANKRRTLGVNIKYVYAGGYRTTPIDLQLSQQQEKTVYRQDQAYTQQLPYYMRGDIRVSMKWNRKRLTSTLSLDIQNVSNRQNVYDQFYDPTSKDIKIYYQTGLIPILNYKLDF